MSVVFTWIMGMNVGFELFDDGEDKGAILDLFIIRCIFFKEWE